MLYEPYRDGFVKSGLDEEIQKMVKSKNINFFAALRPALEELIIRFRKNRKYRTFNIYFGCAGGWQRSVATVEYFKDWLKDNFPKITVTTKHLTMHKR